MWVNTGIASLEQGLGYRMERRRIVLDFPAGTREFYVFQRVQTVSYLVGNGAYSRGVRWPEFEPIELPSNVKVKIEWNYNSTPQL
jgi:hypothetical protein